MAIYVVHRTFLPYHCQYPTLGGEKEPYLLSTEAPMNNYVPIETANSSRLFVQHIHREKSEETSYTNAKKDTIREVKISNMASRSLIAAGVLAVLAFVYGMLELRDLLFGFIIGAAILNIALIVSYLDESGRLQDIQKWVSNPGGLGPIRLAGGLVGGGIIILYAIWLAQDLAAGVVALGLFWLLLLLTADPRRLAVTE